MENFDKIVTEDSHTHKNHINTGEKENEYLALLQLKHEKLQRQKQKELESNSKVNTTMLEKCQVKKDSDITSKQKKSRYAFPILPPFHPYKLRTKKHPLMILREYSAPYSKQPCEHL